MYCFCLSIDNRSESEKWREIKGNVELLVLDMCIHMCIVFAFQLIRAKEVRIYKNVKRSEEKWHEVMTCDVSPVAMFLDYNERERNVVQNGFSRRLAVTPRRLSGQLWPESVLAQRPFHPTGGRSTQKPFSKSFSSVHQFASLSWWNHWLNINFWQVWFPPA